MAGRGLIGPRRRSRLFLVCLALLLTGLYYYRQAAPTDVDSKVTIVITSYQTAGLRPTWLKKTVETYLTSREFEDVVDQVILVWNAVNHLPPRDLAALYGLTIVTPELNSLNNRWIHTLPYIRTKAVVNLDDDVFLEKSALSCLLTYFFAHPTRLIGPFARRTKGGEEYIMDELIKVPRSPHNLILPRITILSRENMKAYGNDEYESLRDYVDSHDAHCDDVLLNAITSHRTGLAPLRVALPASSVVDYSAVCAHLDVVESGGLADQTSRVQLRSECLKTITSHFPSFPLVTTTEAAMCIGEEAPPVYDQRISLERWRQMSSTDPGSLCPKLDVAQSKKLDGVEGELQLFCPELHGGIPEWISSVVQLSICSDGSKTASIEEKMALIASAKHQCGSWCVWDLRTPEAEGWHLTSGCFEKMGPSHSCAEWFYQRPHLRLSGSDLQVDFAD